MEYDANQGQIRIQCQSPNLTDGHRASDRWWSNGDASSLNATPNVFAEWIAGSFLQKEEKEETVCRCWVSSKLDQSESESDEKQQL